MSISIHSGANKDFKWTLRGNLCIRALNLTSPKFRNEKLGRIFNWLINNLCSVTKFQFSYY